MALSRPVIRTYARRERSNHPDDDLPVLKRRRVDQAHDHDERDSRETQQRSSQTTCLSSETSHGMFSSDTAASDGEGRASTPPSSPPSLPDDSSKHGQQSSLHMSSTLHSRPRIPLTPRHVNILSSTAPLNLHKQSKKVITKQRLVQTQINLGASLSKTCKICGMTYVPSSEEDATLHKRYHTQCVNGIDLGRAFRKAVETRTVWHSDEGDCVAVVTVSDTALAKTKARAALQIAQHELGAVEISEQELWSDKFGEKAQADHGAPRTATKSETTRFPRYKVFLYIKGTKCVGVCLAESITKAHEVVAKRWEEDGMAAAARNNGLAVYNHEYDTLTAVSSVRVGISRIWVSSQHRREGVGSALLDSVKSTFCPRGPIPKSMVAFSQPTDLGKTLAKQWTGLQVGWKVYFDHSVAIEHGDVL